MVTFGIVNLTILMKLFLSRGVVDLEGPLKVSPRRILLQKFGSTSKSKPLFEQRVFKGLLKKDNPSKPKPEKAVSYKLFF